MIYLKAKTIFTATEARQNFFELLRLVEKGQTTIIVKKDQGIRFRITLEKPEKKKDINKILKEMGKIGLKIPSWEKAKKIIVKMHDPRI